MNIWEFWLNWSECNLILNPEFHSASAIQTLICVNFNCSMIFAGEMSFFQRRNPTFASISWDVKSCEIGSPHQTIKFVDKSASRSSSWRGRSGGRGSRDGILLQNSERIKINSSKSKEDMGKTTGNESVGDISLGKSVKDCKTLSEENESGDRND